MADSSVEITAGSGTPVDTRTVGTGDHRQVVVLGDPSTNTGVAPVDVTYGLAVDVTRSELPSGAATAARQDTGNASLSSIDGKITACNTGAVTVSTSALPSGAATSAKQDTGNASLSSIDGKTPALGQALAAASVPVVLTAAQVSTLTPPAAITGFATEATLSTLNGKVTAVNTGAVVVSSSALPSGAATAAKQPALGTAGTASADVITVQGVASMTALKVDGSAVTQPVSGTVTASQGGTWNITNVSGTVSLPTGAATESTLSTLNGKVTACNTGAVTISAALPAGTNAIGKLSANSGVDIGDVDILSVIPGTSATSLGKAEDATHTTGDTGVMALAVRNDAKSTLAGTDGDYSPVGVGTVGNVFSSLWYDSTIGTGGPVRLEDAALSNGNGLMVIGIQRQDAPTSDTSADGDVQYAKSNSLGALWVDINSTAQSSAANGLLKAEDAAHTTGDAGVMLLAVRNDSAASFAGTTGDYSAIAVNSVGAVQVNIDANSQTGTSLIRSEDAVATSGQPGVPALFKRTDALASQTSNDGDYSLATCNSHGAMYTDPIRRGTFTHTQPTIANTTNVTLVASNAERRYLLIQNNSAANIMVNLNNEALTGIAPTATNLGIVIAAGAAYETPPNACPTAAVTVYQSSGGSINTVSVIEGS